MVLNLEAKLVLFFIALFIAFSYSVASRLIFAYKSKRSMVPPPFYRHLSALLRLLFAGGYQCKPSVFDDICNDLFAGAVVCRFGIDNICPFRLDVTASTHFSCVFSHKPQTFTSICSPSIFDISVFYGNRECDYIRSHSHHGHGQQRSDYAFSSGCCNDLKKFKSSLSASTSRACLIVVKTDCLDTTSEVVSFSTARMLKMSSL